MNLYTKQKQVHRHRKQTYGYQRVGHERSLGFTYAYTTVYKTDYQQEPTVQHMEYIQYFIMTYKGKESKKEYNCYTHTHTHTHTCCCSVTKSCLTLCNPMYCSMPGLHVTHHILEFAEDHVH